MRVIPQNVQKLIDEFASLPGIGPKTAQRLTFYLLRSSDKDLDAFGSSVLDLKKEIKTCSTCSNIAESDPCHICDDQRREKASICVVEEPLDVVAIERTGKFQGLYHVLGGVISPIEGVGPDDLYIKQLIDRLKDSEVEEIILATNPSIEGEATALYLQRLINPLEIKITRIARGLPVGGDLEYADEVTLSRAIEGRLDY
jgi:recombination protein RecR